MNIRAMRPDDIRDGLRFCRASGWNQGEEDWRALLTLNPSGFVAALSEGRVVGTGGAIRYGSALGWVCMILVDPESRGWGVGTRVMEEVLSRLADLALVGLDATPGGRPVYLKLGFRDARALARLEARVGTSVPGHPRAARPLVAADLPAVLDRDRRAFGADRGEVLRWLFGQAPEYAWGADSGGSLEGYCSGPHRPRPVAESEPGQGEAVERHAGSRAHRERFLEEGQRFGRMPGRGEGPGQVEERLPVAGLPLHRPAEERDGLGRSSRAHPEDAEL